MKECNRCGVKKSEKQFHKHALEKDGLQRMCKQCFSTYDDTRRQMKKARKKALKARRSIRPELLIELAKNGDVTALQSVLKGEKHETAK